MTSINCDHDLDPNHETYNVFEATMAKVLDIYKIDEDPRSVDECQEIGLVTLMFLNFYFLMFLLQFSSMFPLLTYSQSFFSLIC